MHTPAESRTVSFGDNSWSSHFKGTLALGIPLIGAQMAQLGIHTTDVAILGRLGAEHLAAIVLSGQFLFTIFIFGSGFSIAVVPMVAQAYGRGDVVSVRRSIRMGLWVVIAFWLATLPVFLNAESILLALGQVPSVSALVGRYVMIAQLGMLPGLVFVVLRALVSATGHAGIILWVTIATLVINAILAYVLVLGHFGFPALGMDGAAIASVFVQTAGAAFIILYVQMHADTRKYDLFVRFWRPDWHALWEVVHLGLPISITILAEVALFSGASLLMGWIGTAQLAAHGIALQLASIAFMIPLGLSQAATVRIGLAHGLGDHLALVRASVTITIIASAVALMGGVVYMSWPLYFGSWFIDPQAEGAAEVLRYAGPMIAVAGIFQLVDGLQAIASGLLRGLKDTRVPMFLALVSYWPIGFTLAWVLAFPMGFGGIGIWFGFLIGLLSASILLCARFVILARREINEKSR